MHMKAFDMFSYPCLYEIPEEMEPLSEREYIKQFVDPLLKSVFG